MTCDVPRGLLSITQNELAKNYIIRAMIVTEQDIVELLMMRQISMMQ